MLNGQALPPLECAPPVKGDQARRLAAQLGLVPTRGFIIVVLNYRGLSDTVECLASLHAIGIPVRSILVVDNGSPPTEAERISAAHPGLPVLRLLSNVGYCGGNNAGCTIAQAAGATYVFALNNDTTVEPGLVEALSTAGAEHPDAVLMTPKITWYHSPGTIWFGGGSYCPWLGYPTVHGRRQRDDGRFDRIRHITFATGCALSIRLDRVKRIDTFVPELFAYAEDLELSLHVMRNGGTLLYVPHAVVRHKEGLAFEQAGGQPLRAFLSVRNLLLVARTYLRWYHWITAIPMFTVGYVARFAGVYAIRRDWDSLTALLRGCIAGLCTRLPATLRGVRADRRT